jgi:uncharacterized protein (DUF2236 family)
MKPFVSEESVVRRIWGTSDTILFIFAGAAAEFALNKAVDWLFFTGRLPADPLGRLFSTVQYARDIVFSNETDANAVIDRMAAIHKSVENARGYAIPMWAYRDVLYMLIDYSIRSHELLIRRLADVEKEEVYDVFRRVGSRMKITDLPINYQAWVADRQLHLANDIETSQYTKKLYRQYRVHLGAFRFFILCAAQGIVVPPAVRSLLRLNDSVVTRFFIRVYKLLTLARLQWFFKSLILPPEYLSQVRALDSKA